jgi:hypothetical protein
MACPPPRRPVTSASADQPSTASSRSYPAHCPERLSGYYGTKDLGTPSCAEKLCDRPKVVLPGAALPLRVAYRQLLAQNYQKFGWNYQAGMPGDGLYPSMKYKRKPVE